MDVIGRGEFLEETGARVGIGLFEAAFDDVGRVLGETELDDLKTDPFEHWDAKLGGEVFQNDLNSVVAVRVLG